MSIEEQIQTSVKTHVKLAKVELTQDWHIACQHDAEISRKPDCGSLPKICRRQGGHVL